jgi:hypothetical protein
MHRGLASAAAMGLEGGKGGGGMGRHGYRRDGYRPPERNGFMERGGAGTGGTAENSMHKGSYDPRSPTTRGANNNHSSDTTPATGGAISGSPQVAISDLEKRVSGVQQELSTALHKMSEKENEKFDLIFAILSELQSRQAQLEESVRSLKAQYGGGQPGGGNPAAVAGAVSTGTTGNHQASQQAQHGNHQANALGHYGSGHTQNSNGHQTYAPMGGQMNTTNTGQQQQMQPHAQAHFTGVMQADGSQAMFTAVPQVVVVSSPTAAGMQYAVPQILSPNGAMQPMHPQMAMQFIGQNSGQDMNGFGVSGGNNSEAAANGTNTGGSQPQVQQQGANPEGAASAPRSGQTAPQQAEKEKEGA